MGTSAYAYYYDSVTPNPHTHLISPNPHVHGITPNPHRHAMRFFESGSIDGRPRIFDDGCKIDCNVLVKLIYDSLNSELAGSKTRVTAAAKKGNWITANKIGRPICNYLENYYLYRVICYLRSRVWYTEYESLSILPTQLTIQETGLILTNSGNNIVGLQGSEQAQGAPIPPSTPQQPVDEEVPIQTQHLDVPAHVDTPHNDTVHNDIIHNDIIISHSDIIPHVDTPHNDTPHNDTPHNDTYTQTHSDIVHNDTYFFPHTDTMTGGGGGGGGGGHSDVYGEQSTFI
jgi:hypothetical protein